MIIFSGVRDLLRFLVFLDSSSFTGSFTGIGAGAGGGMTGFSVGS